MKLKIVAAFFTLTLVAGFALAPLSTAFADPEEGSPASCRGFEANAVPPGSSSEEPNGQQSVLAIVDSIVAAFGLKNRGAVMVILAQLHLGSHEACE
jgi:hypothetical protein